MQAPVGSQACVVTLLPGFGGAVPCPVSRQRRGHGRRIRSSHQERTDSLVVDVHTGTSIPFGVLSKTAFLLASVFGRAEDGTDERQRLSVRTQYQLRLMTSLQARALKERDDFALFLARSGDTVTGVLTVSLGLSASGAKNYVETDVFGHGTRVFSLCNMAVKEEFRRRGIATHMLKKAEEHTIDRNPDGTIVMVLSVDKYNEEAQRLYEGIGYRIDEAWEDPRWVESIERGAVDVARRVLYWKRL